MSKDDRSRKAVESAYGTAVAKTAHMIGIEGDTELQKRIAKELADIANSVRDKPTQGRK